MECFFHLIRFTKLKQILPEKLEELFSPQMYFLFVNASSLDYLPALASVNYLSLVFAADIRCCVKKTHPFGRIRSVCRKQ